MVFVPVNTFQFKKRKHGNPFFISRTNLEHAKEMKCEFIILYEKGKVCF